MTEKNSYAIDAPPLAIAAASALSTPPTRRLGWGFVFALVPSCVLLVRHGMTARKMALPLVPFLGPWPGRHPVLSLEEG